MSGILFAFALWFAQAAPSGRDGGAVLYPRADASAQPKPAASPGGTGTIVLVIILGAAGGWMLWNKLRGTGPLAGNEHKLSIAETRSLGSRQFLVVASYEGRKFLLGVVPGRIDLLSGLDGGPMPKGPTES